MKKCSFLFLMVFLLCLPALYWLPWWTTALVGFFVVLFLPKGRNRNLFWITGIAGGLCWLAMVIWLDLANHQLLSQKMAALFHLPSAYLFWPLEGLIGFITTGLGGWAASSLKREN